MNTNESERIFNSLFEWDKCDVLVVKLDGLEGNIFTKDEDILKYIYKKLSDFKPQEKCPICGAGMKAYWHRLTPILVDSLVAMKKRVIDKGDNDVQVSKELNLTKSQYNNFQKLRFHGMIAHVKDEDRNNRSGHWLITRRGSQFLRGEIEVPVRVQTFRNKIVDRDTNLVKIADVIGSTPYLEEKDDFQYTIQHI